MQVKFVNGVAVNSMLAAHVKMEIVVTLNNHNGPFDHVDDHIKWLMKLPYVQSVSVEEAFVDKLPYTVNADNVV